MTLRVAVLGATGFLGSHIAARWAIRPDTTVDGMVRSEAAALPAGVNGVPADLRDLRALTTALADTDVVVNAAAASTAGNLIVRACASAGVRRIVHISSVAVFGVTAIGRVADDVASTPTSNYGRAKLMEEDEIRAAALEARISVVVLRVPAVYGARMNGPPLRLARWVQKARPVPRAGGRRSLMYVENLAAATEAAAMMPSNGSGAYVAEDGYTATPIGFAEHLTEALGLASPRVIPIPPSVIRMGTRVLEVCPDIALAGVRPSDLTRWVRDIVADGHRFETVSGFRPPIAVDEAMKRTAEWLRTGYDHTVTRNT